MGNKKKRRKEEEYSKSTVKMLRAMNEMIKSKPNEQGDYDIKKSHPHRKKTRRQIRCLCTHWRLDKNDTPQPTIDPVNGKPGFARCRICKAEFPWAIKTIDPAFPEQSPYTKEIDDFLGAVNTVVFYATKYSSGKAEDFGVFAALRKGIREFREISYAVSYAFTKQKQFTDRANQAASDFGAYGNAGFKYT